MVQTLPTEVEEKEREPRSARWGYDFRETPLPPGIADIGDYYYRSECRPLKELHPIYRRVVVSHCLTQHFGSPPSFREWLNLRDRARKDLYWLGKECIGTAESGSGFVEHVHREMCDMFVKKNFDGVYHAGYTLDDVHRAIDRQPREKEALFLCPTGAFKSTANKVDSAQWMLNAPDVRIFIMTGSGNLSRKFLKEVKGFFYKPSGTRMTRFQSLFPEYVVEGEDGYSAAPLTTPARVHSQPGTPTLWVNSIDGAVAGWHCDVWKGDDIVNEENSNTEDTREKLKDRYDNVSQNRPDEWAFRDHLGTRYFPDDWYGSRLEEARQHPDTNALKYLCRSAWTVKPEFSRVPIRQLQEHMVTLYFPEKMPFKALMAKCRQNEKTFRCQQLNQPAAGDLVCHFDRQMIEDHTILIGAVPKPKDGSERRVAIIWDTAHEENSSNDYSAGAVGYCDRDAPALFVLEVRYGKWRDSQVASEVVELHWKWKAMFSEIEKFHGWELLGREIQRISLMRYRKPIPILWRETDPAGKKNRIKSLEILLAGDQLWFIDGDWMELATEQFVKFTGLNMRRRDDIPDAVAGLQKLMPAQAIPEDKPEETETERKLREARELQEKFLKQHSATEYGTIFPMSDPAPTALPTAADISDSGPGRIFGTTGIHL